jgi:hypothetical protein
MRGINGKEAQMLKFALGPYEREGLKPSPTRSLFDNFITISYDDLAFLPLRLSRISLWKQLKLLYSKEKK